MKEWFDTRLEKSNLKKETFKGYTIATNQATNQKYLKQDNDYPINEPQIEDVTPIKRPRKKTKKQQKGNLTWLIIYAVSIFVSLYFAIEISNWFLLVMIFILYMFFRTLNYFAEIK